MQKIIGRLYDQRSGVAPLLKAAMRNLAMPLVVLIGGFGLSFGSALASETTMHKYTAEELKSVCEKAGGSFSQDGGGYGCGTNCQGKPGTDFILSCKKNEKKCFVLVPGPTRTTSHPNALIRSPRGSHTNL